MNKNSMIETAACDNSRFIGILVILYKIVDNLKSCWGKEKQDFWWQSHKY